MYIPIHDCETSNVARDESALGVSMTPTPMGHHSLVEYSRENESEDRLHAQAKDHAVLWAKVVDDKCPKEGPGNIEEVDEATPPDDLFERSVGNDFIGNSRGVTTGA